MAKTATKTAAKTPVKTVGGKGGLSKPATKNTQNTQDNGLIIEEDGACLKITLNRPDHDNAINLAMIEKLDEVLETLSRRQDLSVILFEGAGKGFCAGHDLKELMAQDNITQRRRNFLSFADVMMKLVQAPIPSIAVIDGPAMAAGCQLVASCDLAFATKTSEFSLPGINHGLACSTAAVPLLRNIGRKRTMRLLLEGQSIDAQTACDYGLINDVVANKAALTKLVNETVKIITGHSRPAIRQAKESFYRQADLDQRYAYDYSAEAMAVNFNYADTQEGIKAFIEKRPAKWQHKM